MNLRKSIAYAGKVLPAGTWRSLRSHVDRPVHLIIALADHFEPSVDPEDRLRFVPRFEQERRLEHWTKEYQRVADPWRDSDGRPLVHTYFYPAEQYDQGLVEMLVDHCRAGWGEVEIHLHHGMFEPDTAENTRQTLTRFRDQLAYKHLCLAMEDGSAQPRYSFVHGNFALANSARGRDCGVDSEMRILAETGCYADFTLPTAPRHPSQTAKINSLYECALSLDNRAPQRKGIDVRVGRIPRTFPLIIQGPLLTDLKRSFNSRRLVMENGSITARNPLSLHRLSLWKRAQIQVQDRPEWLFIKLHCHSMDPTQEDAVIGEAFCSFLEKLVCGAESRSETLHFVTTREMANIVLAACDGRDGNPSNYRDYRFKPFRNLAPAKRAESDSVAAKG